MKPSRWQSALRRLRGGAAPQSPGSAGPELETRLDEFEAVVASVAPPVEDVLPERKQSAARRRAQHALEQEYDMGERLTCSAEGIAELIIETIADDARIRPVAEISEIRIMTGNDSWEDARLVVEGERVRVTGGTVARVEAPPGIAISIEEALGDLRAKGLRAPLRIQQVHGDLRLEDTTESVEVEALLADALLDNVAALRVVHCAGDLRFTGGELQAETVLGDTRVEAATSVRSVRVHGDVWVEKVEGDLEIGQIHGDARLNDIGGTATLDLVAGDLRASSIRGGLRAGHIHGDAQLIGPFTGAAGYTMSADGDVDIRLTADDNVRLSVRALGRIRSNLSLIPSADGTPAYTATLGEGATPVTITCNGDLRIDAVGRGAAKRNWEKRWGPGGDPFAELSGLGDRIRQQVSASLAAAGINPETGEININVGPGKTRAGRGRAPEPPRAPQPPRQTTTSDQMTVLKMLEEGRITPEEADALLRALGA